MAQVPWFSSVVSSTDFESYDFYVKTKENGAPGEYEAVFALTVSPKLSKDQKKVLKAELQKAKKHLQKEGSIETAFNRVRNGETVSKRIHGTWWILNSDQTKGELMYTIEHNRRYGLYFYKDLFTNTPMESIQSINLKAFGFMKGIANGVGIPIGIIRSLKRTPNEYTKKFIFGFYLEKGPDFAVYAKINNGFLYPIGFFLGIALSIITMDMVLFIIMLPTGLVAIAIKIAFVVLTLANGGNPLVGYLIPGIIINGIFVYLAFIL